MWLRCTKGLVYCGIGLVWVQSRFGKSAVLSAVLVLYRLNTPGVLLLVAQSLLAVSQWAKSHLTSPQDGLFSRQRRLS